MRQMQVTAGSLVVPGIAPGLLASPWSLLLSGVVGAGLLLAGDSDSCLLPK